MPVPTPVSRVIRQMSGSVHIIAILLISGIETVERREARSVQPGPDLDPVHVMPG